MCFKILENNHLQPYFITKHLNHNKNSDKLVITEWYPSHRNVTIPMYCCPLSSSVQPVVQKLDYPTSVEPWCCTLKCSCDGLVVIHIIGKSDLLVLWNPSTRESILLPYPEFPQRNCSSHMGLGYDSTIADYKILKIDSRIDVPAQILALKGGSWRNIDKHPLAIHNLFSGLSSLAVVHQAFHWFIAEDRKELFLVSFSISNQVYGEIPLPDQVLRSTSDHTGHGVEVLEGMLCLYSRNLLKAGFTIWVMKDYGVKESWNVLFTIVDPSTFIFQPIYRFADGEVLFWCAHAPSPQRYGFRTSNRPERYVFRTSNGPFVLLPFTTDRCCAHNGIAFTESLISPKSLI